ncbi:MAG: sulfatase-like hydrolase/transferase, partial [Planctomycetaceae bacterium]|nr:sulfatase-like hydrolase/transferase [Planctomycetaceae bacterium]
RGFEEYYGFTSGHWGHYFNALMEHNRELTTGEGYITDDLTSHAIDFIKGHRGEPFFCYVPYNTPHSPMQVPDKWYEKFKDAELKMHNRDPEKEDRPHLLAALAMCENIDWNVGRVLKTLKDLQLEDNTIVVYFSDNGPNGWRWNGDMKGRKGATDEGGVRSPLFVRWPGVIPAGTTVKPIAGAIDLLPTLADLAGIPLISKKPLDGISLKPVLTGQTNQLEDRLLMNHFGFHRQGPMRGQPRISIRSQEYRLDEVNGLYHIPSDPGQRQNIAKQHPELVESMVAARNKYISEIAEELKEDERPFPIGYATITNLPARDGRPHGGVQRSGRAPNCSFFQNWTGAADDSITWDVEVGTAGEYEVVILYTCPQNDVGSTFEVRLNDAVMHGKVSEAHDPPLYGAESDRTPDRGSESYVKDFKPMSVGTIKLEKGTGVLTLKALKVPGKTVMDVRMVRLFKK